MALILLFKFNGQNKFLKRSIHKYAILKESLISHNKF